MCWEQGFLWTQISGNSEIKCPADVCKTGETLKKSQHLPVFSVVLPLFRSPWILQSCLADCNSVWSDVHTWLGGVVQFCLELFGEMGPSGKRTGCCCLLQTPSLVNLWNMLLWAALYFLLLNIRKIEEINPEKLVYGSAVYGFVKISSARDLAAL